MSGTDKDEPAQRKSFRRRYYTSPPGWFINHVWTAPQRQAARIDCRDAAKQYRACGHTDVEPTVAQHRHGATWLWS